ncbi:MAG: phytoene desaturase [Anaerolineales bacterium]|nr:phytoene desaturase [Anaerolineales bacterium]
MDANKTGKTALVIGAGIAGITVAGRLAKQGYRVCVLEKCEIPGGRCGRMTVDGYHFDTGVTFFLMPELYAETYAALGERMEDHLTLQQVDPTYHIYFNDDSQMRLTPDMSAMKAQLEAMEPGSFRCLLRYLDEAGGHYKMGVGSMLTRGFYSLPQFINPRMLLLFLRLRAYRRHTGYVRRFFKDPRLQAAFTFQDMYMGLSPYASPATYSFLQYAELIDGLWYPQGGLYRITESLVSIVQKLGVEFSYNMPVAAIETQGGRAIGVTLADGRFLPADVVVANAEPGYVYSELLPDDGTADRIDRMEYGCSTLMFYWGLDRQVPGLGAHNLFLCGDYKKGFEDIFRGVTMPEMPNFYIHAPVRLDASLAPAGHDLLYVAVPVRHIDRQHPQDWEAVRERARTFVLGRLAELGMPGVEERIRTEISFDPLDWQKRYNLPRGSVHGLSHKLTQMAYFRPHNRHARYRNLYFVGAGTHPGTGVPTVMVSARLAAERIRQEAPL